MGDQRAQLRLLQVHRLRANETASRPDKLFDFPIRIDGSVDSTSPNLDSQGRFDRAERRAGDRARHRHHPRPHPALRLSSRTACGRAAAGSAAPARSTDNDFFRESFQARLRLRARQQRHPRAPRRLPVVPRRGGPGAHLQRLGHRSRSPARRTHLQRPAGLLHARVRSRACRAPAAPRSCRSSTPSSSRRASRSTTPSSWEQLDVQRRPPGRATTSFYGQGLREDSGNVSGFALAPGNKYKMYEIDCDDMMSAAARRGLGVQRPRHGLRQLRRATTRPPSSLPRAASWDRNLRGATAASSSTRTATSSAARRSPAPRASSSTTTSTRARIDEYILGTARQITARWTGRAYARYRYGNNFWEDTNNTRASPSTRPRACRASSTSPTWPLCAPRSAARPTSSPSSTAPSPSTTRRASRSSGAAARPSSAAPTSGATTTATSTRTTRRPPTTPAIFIGSSIIADGAGRQLWDLKYGDLRGDRRHQLKLYGYYQLPWNASVGAFAIYQSGQPWESWDVEVYRGDLTAPSTERHQPLRRAGGLAHDRRPLPARPQLHAGLPVRRAATTCSCGSTSSTSSTSRPATTSRTR